MQESVIKLSHATAYQGESLVINDVSFEIARGEFVYLVGKTGSGKSSILKMLYGDIIPASGDVTVAGFHLNKLSSAKMPYLRRKLGIVFQDFQLLTDRSVHDNLRFVLKATGWNDKHKIAQRINEVLDYVKLSTKGFKMPYELSGGEQQRVVIARALLNNPEIILADEPTGNLDPETSDEIVRLLIELCEHKGTAMLMASHDYLTIKKYPARTLFCEHGKIKETAPEAV
ncbi:MAG: cell division ATP-binding protein FtsE [Bacteroidota bacterium]|jgi:cell division transport system ATP-binding protein|nr:ATP-binding cassette domain-containing protein [Bacteroidota bacterium]